jgi:uncharacterized membrane-anchored protein YjiN (DUF445 family)
LPTAARASKAPEGGLPAAAPRSDAAADPRVAGLRRMRLVATLLLALMTIIFIAATVARVDWPWLPYVRAFAEAGMVGACADWFAVVALFRHPLGLPIPHTGIVPNNKERIAKALGRFITNNFLSAGVLNDKLARVDALGSAASWIGEADHAKRLGEYTALLLPRIAQSLPTPDIGEFLGTLSQRALGAIPAAPLLSKLLDILWAQGEAKTLVEGAIAYGEATLSRNKDYLRRKIAKRSSSWIPKWIDKIMADKALDGMQSTLEDMRNPRHPWRIELQKAVEQLIADLATDPEMRARGETIKTELLANPVVVEQAKRLWAEIESALQSGVPAHAETIAQACEQTLRGIASWVEEDSDRKERLNRRIRAVTQHLLLLYRYEIGAYIERVVREWDSTTLVERMELQVGKDLQYIRINGTLVGGLVGVLIFIASKWIAAF